MTDASPSPPADEDLNEPLEGRPPWVKVVAVIAAVLLLVFAIMTITGGPTLRTS